MRGLASLETDSHLGTQVISAILPELNFPSNYVN